MNENKDLYMNRIQKTWLLSAFVILAAQININLFINDFKISVAVICFSVFLFLLEDFPLIPVTILSALGVYLSRILFYWLEYGVFTPAFETYFPELIFYFVYGFLLYLYDRTKRHPLSKNSAFFFLFFMDYLSNLAELLLRLWIDAFTLKTQLSILLVALARTVIIWMILTVFDRYRLTLLSREHAERYQRLLVLISRLNSEVIWMQKNTALIEDTMNTSYQLFHRMQDKNLPPELSSCALTVAKDIHEIKKEYLLIMRGLSEALHTEFSEDGMPVDDLLKLLEDAITAEGNRSCRQVVSEVICSRSLYTDKHFALLSVFHNLFTNALEASDKSVVHIRVAQTESDSSYVFTVSDDGPGITEEYEGQIFEAGFSTKINYTTGAVNRGLGLNIVRDIIENQFNGTITLASTPGNTTFSIYIPKENLEVTTP